LADLAEEMDAHVDMEIQERLARGMSLEEACQSARGSFGNTTLIHEDTRAAWRFALLDHLVRDLAYALRTMRGAPGFTAAAVLTLTLGIGGNTMMFSVIRAVLLKPLEYRDPERLIRLSIDIPRQNYKDIGFSLERFQAIRSASQSFEGLAASFIGTESVTLSGGAEPLALKGARVSHNFLDVLGVAPTLGRSFLAQEDQRGGPPVAMISAELWKGRFHGDPQVIGKTATVNSVPHTIVGVLPTGFQFPFPDLDVWVTRPAEFSGVPPSMWSTTPVLIGLARLKPDVSLQQARAELDVLARQYASSHPREADARMQTALLSSHLVERVRAMLWMLFGAVGLVLLGACANVAGLLLSRAAARSGEFAVRTALGATRSRLIGQLAAESLLLALAGGVLGALLARWGVTAIANFSALQLPRAAEIRVDGLVLGFTAGLSIATGLLFGLVPALHASRSDPMDALRAHGEGRPSSRPLAPGLSSRGVLVAAQVALSIMLLIGATLLMRSLCHLYSVNPGFQPAHLLTMQIALPPARYDNPQKISAFYKELVRRVEAVPGVSGATVALSVPMSAKWAVPIQVVGQQPVPVDRRLQVRMQSVTPGYLRTMKIALRRGRDLTARDDDLKAPPVVMINESLARRFWPIYPSGQDPIGQRLRMGRDQSSNGLEIVGVVADVREGGLLVDADSELYLPSHLNLPQTGGLMVRTNGDPEHFVNAIRSQVLSIDRDQPIFAVKTMDETLTGSVGQERLTLLLLGAFAAVAVVLALVGLYGIISYSVAQRRREIGIRRALGAQQRDILRLIVGHGAILTLAGVAIGICAALALTRVIEGLLFGVSTNDPSTFAAVAGIFVLIALAASYFPARRAVRLDPMSALR
jgi:predicted permease